VTDPADVLERLERLERRLEFVLDYFDRIELKLLKRVQVLEKLEDDRSNQDQERLQGHFELVKRVKAIEGREQERERMEQAALQQRTLLRVAARGAHPDREPPAA
jgi:hypothetical protein